MAEPLEAAVAELQKKLHEQEEVVLRTKQMINQLCGFMKKPPLYADADMQSSKTAAVRADEYYGKPLQTATREVLERRRHIGPATAREIYDALISGGYDGFQTGNEQNRLTALRISLRKNAKLFHKLPGGQWGLVGWYPKIRSKKADDDADDEPDPDESGEIDLDGDDDEGGDEK
jgi:hypothetical protein